MHLETYHLRRPLNWKEKAYSLVIVLIPAIAFVFSVLSGMLFDIHLGTLVLFLICYTATVFGVTVGFHRLITHRSFKTTRLVKIVLVSLGCMAYEGPPLFWVPAHRRHHKYTERDGDPHSPLVQNPSPLAGLFHAHYGWMFHHTIEDWDYYVKDLLNDPVILIINKYYVPIALSGLIIPGIINSMLYGGMYYFFQGVLICGLVRVFLQQNVTWAINSVCHYWGKKDFKSEDNSRNNWFCAILSHGEGWHNGHHAFPSSAKHGLKTGQIDISYGFIKLLEKLHLVWDVKVPSAEQIQSKTLQPEK